MKQGVILLLTVAAVSTTAWAQESGYPITVVPPGKGPYQFPQGYQTPWDKIEMLVTEKLGRIFILCTVRRVLTRHIPMGPVAGSQCSSAPTAC
jgi:hypothetical protein